MEMSRDLRLNIIVDEIAGDIGDEFTCESSLFSHETVKFNYNSVINEDSIKELSKILKRNYPEHVNQKMWYPVTFVIGDPTPLSLRQTVDKIIDEEDWIGKPDSSLYSEEDRKEIVRRCAVKIKERLDVYSKEYIVEYKIFDNGRVGFRYE